MAPRKIALVGIGKIARDQHVPALAASDAFDLAATASRHAGVEGVDRYATLADLLKARPDIGCVSLCTPPVPRFEDARRALLAGRHVMLEKPPGATLSEVHLLHDIADAQGVTLFATWHSRHAPAVATARKWLAGKDILRVHIDWKEDVRHWHPGQDWVFEPGGLGVFDPGINALSVLTAIYPRALHLTGATLHFPVNRATPIAADLRFHDTGGAQVTAALDWRQAGDPVWDITLETAAGTAILSQGGAVLTVDGVRADTAADDPLGAEYPGLYARFARLLMAEESDVDLTPMRHVADAFTLGRRETAPAFDW